MRGDAAHGVGDLVVHDAAQQPAVGAGVGGDQPGGAVAGDSQVSGQEAGLAQAQRTGQLGGDERGQRGGR